MTVPQHLQYTADHEWLSLEGDLATVGITAFAADALGDIVFVELFDEGTPVTSGSPCGELESTKSVSDFLAPIDGVVVAVNEDVLEDPGLVNSDPYGSWLVRIRVEDSPALLDAVAYTAIISEA